MCLLYARRFVVSAGSLYKPVGAPILLLFIDEIASTVTGWHQRQKTAASGIFRLQMPGNALDILHQGYGIAKDVLVDTLTNKSRTATSSRHVDNKGVIDMAAAVATRGNELSVQFEVARDFPNISDRFCLDQPLTP
jgi:P2-related tail formation protein